MINWFKKPKPDGGATVRYSDWVAVEDDVARQYEIERNTGSTLFQIRCTLQLGSFGDLQHHFNFVLHPTRIQGEGLLMAHFCEAGQMKEREPFTVRTVEMNGGGNLLGVVGQRDADRCMEVVSSRQALTFALFGEAEVIDQLTLPNDGGFEPVYRRVAEQVRAGGVRPGGLFR